MTFKRFLNHFFLLIAICLHSTNLLAQSNNYVIDHLEFPEQFGEVRVYSFAEDLNGFLYLGLDNGFFRYDGHELIEIIQVDESGNLS